MKTFNKKDVFCIANAEDAIQYIGRECYFDDSYKGLQFCIDNNIKGVLKDISTFDEDYVDCIFVADRSIEVMDSRCIRSFGLCLPCELVKEVPFGLKLMNIHVGDYVKFGNYWQSNDKNKEAIEWKVLDIKNGKALLISKYALDCKKYNQSCCNITWEECTLRKWINSDFINNAFSEEEQQIIALTKNDTNGSRTTEDKVFLLSIEEAQKYFKNAEERNCMPTPYAKQHNAWSSDDNLCYWWLRSPGYCQYNAVYVNRDGDVHGSGSNIDFDINAIRVAMWVNSEMLKK